MNHLILNITVYVFQYDVGAYFWAAILDLKIKMVSEHSKHYSQLVLQCVMPELTINDTLFAFLSHLYQEMSLFLVFNMSPAAILGRHLEFEGQDRPKIQWIPFYQIWPIWLERNHCSVFKYGIGGHYWASRKNRGYLYCLWLSVPGLMRNKQRNKQTGWIYWIWMSRWSQNTVKIFALDLGCQTW